MAEIEKKTRRQPVYRRARLPAAGCRLPAENLELEITETVMLGDNDGALDALSAIGHPG